MADGVVVGSTLIDHIDNAKSSEEAVSGVLNHCRQLAEGIRNARG